MTTWIDVDGLTWFVIALGGLLHLVIRSGFGVLQARDEQRRRATETR